MIQIDFDYKQNIIGIQAKIEDKFQEVINKYIEKSLLNPSSIYFISNGTQINPSKSVESQMSDMNKLYKNMKVLVHEIEEDKLNNSIEVKSKDIICPLCQKPCLIKMDNFKFTLFDCPNQHYYEDIKIKDFPETQKIDASKIICDKCKLKNKGDSPNGNFFKCLTCKKNLCLLCKPGHEINHKIINYDEINYICQTHNENFIKYCTRCNKNICFSCDEEHNEHETIFLGDFKPIIEEAKYQIIALKKEIELFNTKIKRIINQLNELMNSINSFYEVNENILNIYDKQNRNYQVLQNIKEINKNNEIFKALNNINKITDDSDQLFNILKLYNNIKEDLAIGIDLGSSKNCIAVYQNDKIEIIPSEYGQKSSPSYIAFTDTKKIFGETAKSYQNPINIIYNMKRLLGLNMNLEQVTEWKKFWPFQLIGDKESGKVKVQITYKNQTKSFYMEELLAMELLQIKRRASKYFGKEVKKAVISVPNCFNSIQRKIIKDASSISGLNVKCTISESVLPSFKYVLDNINLNDEKNILIFDLGACFLNVSIIQVDSGLIEVKAINGAFNLGGEDFTNKLIDYCAKEFEKKTKLNIMKNPKAFRRLRNQCENAKISLTEAKQASIDIYEIMNGEDLFIQISRDKFDELCNELFKKCIQVIDPLINDSGLKKEQIDEILLVGGSSRTPKIQSMLVQYFNGKKPNKSLNPDESVASGAAIQAAITTNIKSKKLERLILLDVIPFSIGIECEAQSYKVLIPRNSTMPCTKKIVYDTYKDNQSSALIKIYEGDNYVSAYNILIEKVDFDGLPRGKKGSVHLEITLKLDPRFNINLIISEKTTKKETNILLEYESYRLKKDYINKLKAEYEKEYELIQDIDFMNYKLGGMIKNIKDISNASYDEINSKKDEIINIIEKLGP